MLALLALPILT